MSRLVCHPERSEGSPKHRGSFALLRMTFIFFIFFAMSCSKPLGILTIVNVGLKPAKVVFNSKEYKIGAGKHFTNKTIKAGEIEIVADDDKPIPVKITGKRTTLVDLSGEGCYIIADFSEQYNENGTGEVKIAEKLSGQKVYEIATELSAQLGEQLPDMVYHEKSITRIHRVDCRMMKEDQKIIDAIASMP